MELWVAPDTNLQRMYVHGVHEWVMTLTLTVRLWESAKRPIDQERERIQT